jgi:hypothetical protein
MEKDELRRAIELKTRKSGRDYWYWKDRPEMECGAVQDVLTAAGLSVEGITNRTDDPPDCEALINGEHCGIEVTELVHEKALKSSIDGPEQHFAWDRAALCEHLQVLISRKDCPEKVKGGPYQRYILVIVTDEMFLDHITVERFLAGASFQAKFITDVFLGLSYEPKMGRCPVFKLPIPPRA